MERAEPAAESRRERDLSLIWRSTLTHLVPVREPLVLISQIQRSGGTLLSQLFDRHPQVHAHPHELKIGHPKESTWPRLDLDASPATWFETLEERPARQAFKRGYKKQSKALLREIASGEVESFPFLLPPSLQWRIFEHCVETTRISRSRDILDAYMTSYFNAWLDNHNLRGRQKRIVTGFTPRLVTRRASVADFFAAYPDGKLLTIVRRPESWFVSARKHKPHVYGDIERAVELWLRSAQAAVAAKERYGDRVFIVSFEELIQDTRAVMGELATYLGIDFDQTLLEPTFNGFRIKADSSFRVSGYGIVADPLDRHSSISAEESSFIERRTREAHELSLSLKGLGYRTVAAAAL